MKRLLAVFFTFFSTFSYGANWYQYGSGDWTENGNESYALLSDQKDSNKDHEFDRVLIARIDHSTSGRQNIYIHDQHVGKHDTCDISEDNKFTVAKFDGQPVKMILYCREFNNVNVTYTYATPETDKGKQYVVDLFKRKVGSVTVEFNGLTGNISTNGFSKAWNSAGGDAI